MTLLAVADRHADRHPGRHLPGRIRPAYARSTRSCASSTTSCCQRAVDRDRPVRLRGAWSSRWATSPAGPARVALAVIVDPGGGAHHRGHADAGARTRCARPRAALGAPRWTSSIMRVRLARRARPAWSPASCWRWPASPAKPRRCCSPRSTTSSGSTDLNAPMASLPVVIFQFALPPYKDWQALAWAGALIITFTVLALSIVARALAAPRRSVMNVAATATAVRTVTGTRRSTPPASMSEGSSIRNLEFLLRRAPGAEEHHVAALRQARSRPSSARRAAASPRCCASSTGCTTSIPNQRAEGDVMLDGDDILLAQAGSSTCCARGSAWCSRSRRRSRCRSTRTSPSASASTRSCPKSELDGRVESALRRAALWDEVKDKLNANGLSLSGGQQQRLCIARTVAVKPGSASCSTSRARRSIRSRPPRSRN